jgi:hypothetical protein
VFFIVLVKLVAAVALMAVNNKQTVCTNSLVLCMRVKVLQPPYTKLVCCLAIVACFDYLFARQP